MVGTEDMVQAEGIGWQASGKNGAVAGGDLQDQSTLQLLVNHIDFGMMPAECVTLPVIQKLHGMLQHSKEVIEL